MEKKVASLVKLVEENPGAWFIIGLFIFLVSDSTKVFGYDIEFLANEGSSSRTILKVLGFTLFLSGFYIVFKKSYANKFFPYLFAFGWIFFSTILSFPLIKKTFAVTGNSALNQRRCTDCFYEYDCIISNPSEILVTLDVKSLRKSIQTKEKFLFAIYPEKLNVNTNNNTIEKNENVIITQAFDVPHADKGRMNYTFNLVNNDGASTIIWGEVMEFKLFAIPANAANLKFRNIKELQQAGAIPLERRIVTCSIDYTDPKPSVISRMINNTLTLEQRRELKGLIDDL